MINPKALSGRVILPGKGTGRSVLAINGNISTVPESEPYVLVTDQLTSNLSYFMSLAQAIISDQADISTDIFDQLKIGKIPCIVSTKYATKRINPGDWVEVDADHNQVFWATDPGLCVFCQKHPLVQVLRTEFFFAIFDGYPAREGHLLIVPVRHVALLADLTQEEFADLYPMLVQVDHFVRETLGADAYNLGLNDGAAAGQTVPHLHFHIIPRKAGDVPNPRGGIRNFLPNPLVEYPKA